MLRRLGKDVGANRAQMIDLMQRHLQEVESWLARSEHVEVLFLPYRHVVEEPLAACRALIDFLSLSANPLDMAQVVEKKYYRQRADAN